MQMQQFNAEFNEKFKLFDKAIQSLNSVINEMFGSVHSFHKECFDETTLIKASENVETKEEVREGGLKVIVKTYTGPNFKAVIEVYNGNEDIAKLNDLKSAELQMVKEGNYEAAAKYKKEFDELAAKLKEVSQKEVKEEA